MDVGLTAEQEMFGQVSGKFAAEISAGWHHGRSPDTADGCTPDDVLWRRIADAGWLALRVPEEHGGVGGTCLDVCVLAEQLGRYAVPAPVLGQLLVTEQLRLRGADPVLLAALAAGETRLGPVLAPDLRDFATGTGAGSLAVDVAGMRRAAVVGDRASAVDLETPHTGVDLSRAFARPAGGAEDLPVDAANDEARHRALAFGLVVLSADLLGAMEAAHEAAVAHATVRKQFGRPIGSFQAVAHLAAESLVSVEATRSAVWYSAWAVDELDPAEALVAARTTKAFASMAGVGVVETAVQLLGGIGLTWESDAHVWQRRIHLDRRLLGDEHTQYTLLAAS